MILRLMAVLFLLACSLSAQPFLEPPSPLRQDSSEQIADRIVQSKKPVLVDFWATWCAPCHMLDPVIKKLEKEYKGKVTFMKIDVDVHRQIAAYFRIQGIPAVFIVKDRTVQKMITGLQPEEAYREALNAALRKPSSPPPDTAAAGVSARDTL